MAGPKTIKLDGVQYAVRDDITRNTLDAFPPPVPTTGQPLEENYGPHRITTKSPPVGIGLKSIYSANRIFDAVADTRFSQITLPRLKTTTTVPAEVAAVEFKGFSHSMGEFFMWGIGLSTTKTEDEAILVWDDSNWTDTTAKDDLAGGSGTGAFEITGGTEHKGEFYIISFDASGLNNGTSAINVAKRTASQVWAEVSLASSTNPMTRGGGGETHHFIVSDGANMFATAFNVGILYVMKSVNDGVGWALSADVQLSSVARAQGMVLYGDGTTTPVLDPWVTAREGLYHIDTSASTFTLRFPFQHPESSHSGQLIKADIGLIFTDGPNAFVGRWDGGGEFVVEEIGPACVDDGLPLTKQGDITAISYDNIRGELACAIGGTAASKNASIYIYNFAQRLWHCMFNNSTANKVIFSLSYSSETAGINRLHWAEDNAVASDSDAFYLNYISENPVVQTAATFASSGTIEDSRFFGQNPSLRKGFLKFKTNADDLNNNSNEFIQSQFSADNASFSTAQDMVTSPVSSVFVDGASTAIGQDAFDVAAKMTLNRGSTNTRTPKLKSWSHHYLVAALKDDDTPLETFEFTIDVQATGQFGSVNLKGLEDVKKQLRTSMAKSHRTLVLLEYGSDTDGLGSSTKVKIRQMVTSEELQEADPLGSQGELKAFVTVTCDEVI